MKLLLSPKELAQAIDVSESSLRRWVDEGRIEASRTAGGHRRIPLSEAIRLVRETGLPIRRPDLLGLPDIDEARDRTVSSGSPDDALYQALEEGNADQVRALILVAFLDGRSIADICDGPLSVAMRRLGEIWHETDRGIFIEHRATDLAMQALQSIRAMVLREDRGDLVAVGGAPPADGHLLPSLMAATVLAAEGFREINTGANTPLDVLMDAAIDNSARLVWLACTMPQPTADKAARFEREARQMVDALEHHDIHVVFGGAGVPEGLTVRLPHNASMIHSMGELAAFARGLVTRQRARPTQT